MSKQKYPHGLAMNLGQDFIKLFTPVTERLVVAGSLRREKEMVSDVEILYVPKVTERKIDFFSTEPYNLAEELISGMLFQNLITMRLSVTGHPVWGKQNKLAVAVKTGIPVDFFATTIEAWWVSLVIRTGSKEMNLELTTGANKLGRTLNAYGVGVTESDGTVIPATSERHVFELCGVRYRQPRDR